VQILTVGGRDFNAGSRTGNVTIGEDETIGRHDHAGTAAAARLPRSRQAVVADCQPNDSGSNLVDNVNHCLRIRIQQRLVVRRNAVWRGVSPAAQGIG
jgi:hypothetical protein